MYCKTWCAERREREIRNLVRAPIVYSIQRLTARSAQLLPVASARDERRSARNADRENAISGVCAGRKGLFSVLS